MPHAQPIPEGFHTLSAHIVVKDGVKALGFYKRAFGAEERTRINGPDGKSLMHAELKIGDSILMVAGESPQMSMRSPSTLGGTPITLALYVTDCDKAFERAVSAGAKAVMPPSDMFWGDRFSLLTDPEGHSWSISTHIKDPTAAEIQKGMKASCGG